MEKFFNKVAMIFAIVVMLMVIVSATGNAIEKITTVKPQTPKYTFAKAYTFWSSESEILNGAKVAADINLLTKRGWVVKETIIGGGSSTGVVVVYVRY